MKLGLFLLVELVHQVFQENIHGRDEIVAEMQVMSVEKRTSAVLKNIMKNECKDRGFCSKRDV